MVKHSLKLILLLYLAVIFTPAYAEEDLAWKLDTRPWKEGFHKEAANKSMISEYVITPETVHNWKELVTVQEFYGLQQVVSPKVYLDGLEKQLKKACPKIQLKAFEYHGSIIYEFSVRNCPGQDNQQELGRVIRGQEGIWVLHYATKKFPLSNEDRNKWIGILKSAKLSS